MTPKTDHLEEDKFLTSVVIGRAWVLIFILAVIAGFDVGSRKSPVITFTPVYVMLLLCFVQVAISLVYARGRKQGPISTSFQICFDLLVVTLIVYMTGAALSPFNFLYLPLTMLAALSYSRRVALTLSLLSGAVYLGLSWATTEGILPLIDGSIQTVEPSGGIYLQTVGLTLGMVLVSYLTHILRGSIKLGSELVEQSKKDLEELDSHHRSVFDGIPQPTIILDEDDKIARINLSARQLFLLGNDCVGDSVLKVLGRYMPALKQQLKIPSSEFKISIEQGESVKKFKAHLSVLENSTLGERCLVLYDLTELESAEEKLAAHERMAKLLARDEKEADKAFWNDGLEIVGESRVVKHVFSLVSRVANTDATVLVNGESGTGKELVARAIHRRSKRNKGPFVPVNCGAIPEHLMESQFFGHTKGAFTGADRNYDGFFKQAHQGTLFLDEIAELPLNMQTKLLRVIQERSVRPLGADKEYEVDVRLISATHRNLREEVDENRFREDLYYRLNVISIPMPPLRNRKEDIPLLIEYFLRQFCSDETELPVLHPRTLELLSKYDYPGNIRELQNIIERAVILGGKGLLPEHLPESITSFKQPEINETSIISQPAQDSLDTMVVEVDKLEIPCNLDQILAAIEKMYLEQALSISGGVKKDAAKLLGINARSLRYRLQKYHLGEN